MAKDINPHIPQYISSAPWYVPTAGPTLKHQRDIGANKRKAATMSDEYNERGTKGKAATKWRKGACENCGATGHKRKECFEKARRIPAKYSNRNIAPDDQVLLGLKLDFDGKRDRWAGFQPAMYKPLVVDEYEKVEEAKRLLKEERMRDDENQPNVVPAADGGSDVLAMGPAVNPNQEDVESEPDSDDDNDKYADKVDMPGTKVDSKQRITVRNLRIREDVAKYLRNLDPESAHYDPKTRSMRDDPNKSSSKAARDAYAGDNFIRYSGDTLKVYDEQTFAWNASEKGVDVHVNAEPTKAELIHKEYKFKKEEIKESVKSKILDKYGGQEYLETPAAELIFSQTEQYVEYSRSGKLIKGQDRPVIKSIYEEDVFPNNHTSVFGSYWKDFQWGLQMLSLFPQKFLLHWTQDTGFGDPFFIIIVIVCVIA